MVASQIRSVGFEPRLQLPDVERARRRARSEREIRSRARGLAHDEA